MGRPAKCLYEFGPFHLDPAEHVLLRDGEPVALRPKDLAVLVALVDNHGHVLTKDELLKGVWPGQFVEEGNLNRHISSLRRVLGESSDAPQYVETVPKVGYRFVAPVREIRDRSADMVIERHTIARIVTEEEEEANGRGELEPAFEPKALLTTRAKDKEVNRSDDPRPNVSLYNNFQGTVRRFPDLGDKPITNLGHCLDVLMLAVAVSQGLPQCPDITGKVSLLDESARPHAAHQLFLFHQAAALFQQQQEGVEGLRPQRDLLLAAEQQALCGVESELAELVNAVGLVAHREKEQFRRSFGEISKDLLVGSVYRALPTEGACVRRKT